MPVAAGLHYFLHEGGTTTRPPLVLIHGAGGDHLFWPPEMRRLAGRRIFTIDLPGHGRSEGPGCQSLPDYTEHVIDLLDAAGISRAALIGHGMGGGVALTLALDHPERVAGIGLIASGARLPVSAAILENAANPATYSRALDALRALMGSARTAPQVKERVFKYYAALRPTVLHGDLHACDRFDVTDQLEDILCPVLVVCGAEDRLTPPRYSESMAERIPGAALQTIDGAGHLLMLEQPRRLAGLVNVFLATIPYTPGM